MGLRKYLSKRKLRESGEPKAVVEESGELKFCVQRHAARRLHYDFRLECKGVLLSWAVPKGPSMTPGDKRLAVHVEDHPLEYCHFEGVIPPGHYGAGSVVIWDEGTYSIPSISSKKESEKYVQDGLKKGHFDFMLNGNKLCGLFSLIRMERSGKDEWLLIKRKDDYSSSKAVVKKEKMPKKIVPMLATLIDEPFDDQEWLFEVKWDGFRALAFIEKGKVQLKSRSDHSFNRQFPEIVKNLENTKRTAILDGEIVVVDEKGLPHFELLQNYQNSPGELRYYVFDLLFLDGQDLRDKPLLERKKLLKQLLDSIAAPMIMYSDHIIGKGAVFFKKASKMHLEGIIGKKISSTYEPRRSADWIKIKTTQRQEVVIGGFTEPRGSREKLGALLVGVYEDDGRLHYVGHVGGGFNRELLNQVSAKMRPLITKKCPFVTTPKANEKVTWIKPKLVCEVNFAEWTKDKIMRQPVFKGLREDKPSEEVKKELPAKISSKQRQDHNLSNLDKVFWPEEKYTKGDLIEYYRQVAPYLLPYLRGRPITLHRYPDGIKGEEFYQKEVGLYRQGFVETIKIQHDGKTTEYLLINDTKSLLFAINLASIDLHPFLSRTQDLYRPDYCVLDLDPVEISFSYVVEIALLIHNMLEEIGVRNYCKTSGGRGLHIFIPLHAKYTFEQSQQFSELIALLIYRKKPKLISMERAPGKRRGQIYIDTHRNHFGQTVVPPYVVRPREHALVSAPLLWSEVKKGLDPNKFNLSTIMKRIEQKGDLFKETLGRGVNLDSALKNIEKLAAFSKP